MPEAASPPSDRLARAGARPATPPPDAPARRRGRHEHARAAVPVALLVLAAALWFAHYERQVTNWIVMTDELLYTKLGVAIGSSLSPVPRVHGEYYAAFSQLYPLVTAPVYRFFDMPTAFELVHLLNGILMASTAIPVYLLARELLSRRWPALLAAALAISIPWVTLGLMVWTESAAYPAFAWALLAMQRSIAGGGWRGDALALVAIAVAFLARTQFVLLALILPLAIAVHEVGYAVAAGRGQRRGALREAWRRVWVGHRALVLLYAAGAAALVPLLLTGTVGGLLGAYAVTTEGALLPPGTWASFVGHLDYLVVGLGILPFVAATGWSLSMLLAPSSRAHHAFAVLGALLVPALALQVASFSLRFAQGFQDRYVFYVAPLLLVGFVVSLADRRRLRLDLLLAGVLAAWLLGFGAYTAAAGPYFVSPVSAFFQVLDGRSQQVGSLVGIADLAPRTVVLLGALLGAIAMAAGLRWLRPERTLALAGTAVLLFMVLETHYVFKRMLFDNGRVATGGTTEGRDWVDQRVGDADVAVMPTHVNTAPDAYFVQALWWDTEFWNKSVTRAYSYDGATTFTPFPFRPIELDYGSGRLAGATDADYLLLSATNVRLRPASSEAIASPDEHLILLRTPGPLRAEWASRGILDDGWTTGGGSGIRLYGSGRRESRRVALTLASSAEVLESRRYAMLAGAQRRSGTLDTAQSARARVDVCVPAAGHADVSIRVDGTTALPDGRVVGLRITSIRSTPSPADRCR